MSIYTALIGTIAQQGQAGGAGGGGGGGATVDPTIATSSSGNYDEAISIITYSNTTALSPTPLTENGSNFSGGSADLAFTIAAANEFSSANNIQYRIFGYIRNGDSGDDNPSWALHSLSQEASNGTLGYLGGGAQLSLITSSYNNQQDNTLATRGYTGIGAYVKHSAGGGRGGLVWATNGDSASFELKATIGGDDTDDIQVSIDYE